MKQDSENGSKISGGSFGYRCQTDGDCNSNMICDPQFNVCKMNAGSACESYYDCATGFYCSGVCLSEDTPNTVDTGIIGYPCPCFYDNQECVDGKCLSISSCSENSDCVSGLCQNGLCFRLSPNGGYCDNDNQCESGNCSNNICQVVNITSGGLGASCIDNSQCNSGLSCRNGRCQI